MPVNSLGKMIQYTSDQSIADMIEADEDDHMVEFIGYVVQVLGTFKVDDSNLFKVIISNGSKKLLLLIWDESIVEKLREELVFGKILHLDACDGKVVKSLFHRQHKLEDLEIVIQPGSKVKTLGFHVVKQERTKPVRQIEFVEIAKATGNIMVKAYVKTVVTPAYNREGMLSFGNGSITDGVHKVVIKVNCFKPDDSKHLEKGMCVMVKGTVNHTGKLLLTCQNISCLEVLENEKKLDENVVSHANKPLKRWNPKDEEECKTKKNSMGIDIQKKQD